jgi:hypothetical protein
MCAGCSCAVQVPLDDLEVDDSPPPSRRPAKPGGFPLWLLVVIIPAGALLLCCVGGIAFVAYVVSVGQKAQQARQEQAKQSPISDITWEEIDQIYNLKSSATNLQKEEAWKKYKGKKVKWQGTVSSMSETFGTLQLQIKMNPATLTSDLLMRLNDDQREKALKLSKGDRVTFVGVLDEWGAIMPTTLSQGEIIAEGPVGEGGQDHPPAGPPGSGTERKEAWDTVGNAAQVGDVSVECLQARTESFSCKQWDG